MKLAETAPKNVDALDGCIFICDNLPFLKSLDTDSVDLICIDPPFAKNETFIGSLTPPLSAEELRIEREMMEGWGVYDEKSAYDAGIEYPDRSGTTANFEDIFRFERDVHEDWMNSIESTSPGLALLIQAIRYTHSDSIAAYIAYMGERMIEIRRILKPTGSVYLHCDHTADAYLRQMMDSIFGERNFRSRIVWQRYNVHSLSAGFDNVADTILLYADENATLNRVYRTPSDAEIDARFPHIEPETKRRFQHVALEQSSNRSSAGETRSIGGRDVISDIGWRWTQKTFDERLARNPHLIYWTHTGRPRYKLYADEYAGAPLGNIWNDIQFLTSGNSERTGYPTQKPQALAKRIIETSTNPDDIVLDCFAGCSYVPVAAQLTGRRWIACDMSPRAWTVVRRQFHKQPDLGILTEGELETDEHGLKAEPQLETLDRIIRVRGPYDLPKRTTLDEQGSLPVRTLLPPPTYRNRPHESGVEIWSAFVEHWGTACWYCGTEKANDRRELQLDHIEPNTRDGRNDDCWNRALACIACNSDKSDRLSPEETVDFALRQGRIPTQARRDEVWAGFVVRREWAKARWEGVKPRKLDI